MIDPAAIREIALKHPRFAMSLAILNQGGGIAGSATVKFSPMEATAEDVVWALKPKGESAAYFVKRREAAELGKEAIVYDVVVSEGAEPHFKTLNLKVRQGYRADPAYTELDVNLSARDNLTLASTEWEVTSWHVRGKALDTVAATQSPD